MEDKVFLGLSISFFLRKAKGVLNNRGRMDTLVRAGSSRKSLEQALAARLVRARTGDQTGLERALRLQASSDDRLETILTKLGLAGENDIAGALAAELGLEVAMPARRAPPWWLNAVCP
jgi:hypothetical protein